MKLKGNVDLCDFLFYRRISGLLTYALAKTRITPNAISLLSFLLTLFSGVLFATGNRVALLLGVLLLQIARIFDCSDGELARLRGQATEFGWWLDCFLDRLKEVIVYIGVTIGCYRISGNSSTLILGMFALSNVLLSGFINTLKSNLSFMKKAPALNLARGIYLGGVSTHIFLLSLAVLFDLIYYLLLCYATIMAVLWAGQFYLVVRAWKTLRKS